MRRVLGFARGSRNLAVGEGQNAGNAGTAFGLGPYVKVSADGICAIFHDPQAHAASRGFRWGKWQPVVADAQGQFVTVTGNGDADIFRFAVFDRVADGLLANFIELGDAMLRQRGKIFADIQSAFDFEHLLDVTGQAFQHGREIVSLGIEGAELPGEIMGVLSDFLDAIEEGRDPAIPGEEALATQRVIEDILAQG